MYLQLITGWYKNKLMSTQEIIDAISVLNRTIQVNVNEQGMMIHPGSWEVIKKANEKIMELISLLKYLIRSQD